MTAKSRSKNIADLLLVGVVLVGVTLQAQQKAQPASPSTPKPAAPAPATAAPSAVPSAPATSATAAGAGVTVPADYTIGPEDVLSIVYWRDKDMSSDVAVRPDGKISLPLLNDVQAAGLTPAQLREKLVDASKKYIEDPNITVVVQKMNSRKVFITGEVDKPGPYALFGPMSVLQLISMAGGLREYADSKKILVVRTDNGKQVTFPFNYKDVVTGKNLKQNIELKSGDTVVVP
jgi:polysaccharide biosynthesis/export protein